jgi:cytochrome c-type biogenesis protein CcmH/NrfG
VDLGDRYFQEGNVAQATQTWKRILVTVQPRARALSALGEVYLEHDMAIDALAAFKEAVQLEPANLAYRKQLASAHERQRSYADARAIWEDLATRAKQAQDKNLAREARTRRSPSYRRGSRPRRPTRTRAVCWPRCRCTCAAPQTPR